MYTLDIRQYATAREFNDAIQLTNELWCPRGTIGCNWVFRGHADAAWELKPRAWRADGLALLDPLRRKNESFAAEMLRLAGKSYTFMLEGPAERIPEARLLEVLLQTVAEYTAVEAFADLADEVGHPAPRDGLDEWVRFINCLPDPKTRSAALFSEVRTFESGT